MEQCLGATARLVGLLHSQLRLAELLQAELEYFKWLSPEERSRNDPAFLNTLFMRLLEHHETCGDLIEELAAHMGRMEPIEEAPPQHVT